MTYEKLAKEIVEAVVNASPNLKGAVTGHGPTNRIGGASGFRHQIDVSIEILNEKLLLVECKRYQSKVTVSDMLILIARINDIRKKRSEQVTGCFFTTKGYTGPAKKVGTFYDIELNTFTGVKPFAVHIAGNTFIKPEAMDLNVSVSGSYAKNRDV
jgi:hypothetical protein